MNGVEFVYADHRILAKQLQEYYDDRKELKKDSEGALKHAQNYAWPVVCKVWDEALGARIDE
jgi:glycosyltransferase involved in cell wall biosynthesis